MIQRTFSELIHMVSATDAANIRGDAVFRGVSTDSRRIEKGNLFIPLVGEKFDGHDFVPEALAKGASASLWQKDRPLPSGKLPLILVNDTLEALQRMAACYREQLPVKVVGVTGSNGKTTTKDMIASVLGTTYRVHKTSGNLNNHIGLPLTILGLGEETEMAVLEMGMSGRGEIERLSLIARPDVAVITNIGEAHLMQLGSRREIARAKLEILRGLKPGGLLVFNGDEPLLEEELLRVKEQELGEVRLLRFGVSRKNDIYPLGIMLEEEGTYFVPHPEHPDGLSYYIPLLGKHNVINALAAIAVGKWAGIHDIDIVRGLKSLKATGMRIERIRTESGWVVLNDAYNASPTSMKAAIDLFKDLKGFKRKILVLGDMLELGEREIEYHREIGRELSSEFFDYIFTFGSLAKYIALEAEKKFSPGSVQAFADKGELIGALRNLVGPNDVVLVKGSRGMKLEDVVAALT